MLRFLVISLSIFFARSVTYFYTLLLLLIDSLWTYSKMLANFLFTFENLLFSACFRSLWMAFVCSLLLSVKLQCLHFYDVSKKPSLALSFSVLLCQATLFRQSHICICSFLFRLLSSNLRKNTSQVLVFSYCYSWVFLSISFVFLSIVSRFLCNFLDVMQFSRYNSIASLFGIFFEHLLRSFSHVFLYAPSLAHWFSSNFLKNACNIFLKVEPSKLNSSFFSP